MQKPVWLIEEIFTEDEKFDFYVKDIELAREDSAIQESHRLIKKLSDSGVGYYIGEGLFKVTIGGSNIEIDLNA